MKIKYKLGNLIQAPEYCLIHGCNAHGVMGSGVALSIKNEFPLAYEHYRRYCLQTNDSEDQQNPLVILGAVVFVNTNGKIIGNCITQENYGRGRADAKPYVSYDAVRSCMTRVNEYLKALAVSDVAMPMIGAGLGGGKWSEIAPIIESELIDVQPIVYVLSQQQYDILTATPVETSN